MIATTVGDPASSRATSNPSTRSERSCATRRSSSWPLGSCARSWPGLMAPPHKRPQRTRSLPFSASGPVTCRHGRRASLRSLAPCGTGLPRHAPCSATAAAHVTEGSGGTRLDAPAVERPGLHEPDAGGTGWANAGALSVIPGVSTAAAGHGSGHCALPWEPAFNCDAHSLAALAQVRIP